MGDGGGELNLDQILLVVDFDSVRLLEHRDRIGA